MEEFEIASTQPLAPHESLFESTTERPSMDVWVSNHRNKRAKLDSFLVDISIEATPVYFLIEMQRVQRVSKRILLTFEIGIQLSYKKNTAQISTCPPMLVAHITQ
jgi:hypothetical protein